MLKSIVIEAGNILLNAENLDIQEKTSYKDLVTQYDKQVQEFLIKGIKSEVKDAVFLSEELNDLDEKVDLNASNLFIIDPIDGTTNFVHHLNYSAISVAWYQKGKPFYGIVYNPFVNEVYEAVADSGIAELNNKEITVSDSFIKNSLVLFGTSPYDDLGDKTFDIVKGIFNKCQDVRRLGSAALDICQVAAGRASVFFEGVLSLWDHAASGIILKEAGGLIKNFDGEDIKLSTEKTSIIVGNNTNIKEICKIF